MTPAARAAILVAALILGVPAGYAQDPRSPLSSALGPPRHVGNGITLFRVDGADPASPDLPQSIRLLRLDTGRVRLASALATGEIPGRATVADVAHRVGAIAAVNAGFFSPVGEPVGLLRIDGRLLSDTSRARGAVALDARPSGTTVLFDQVSARVRLRFRVNGAWHTVPVDGVDAVRGNGRLVLFTPGSGATTDTTGGLEWTLAGTPLRDSAAVRDGNSPIPPKGYVLSYGGDTVPSSLAGLTRASSVQVRDALTVASGQRVRDWMRAPTIVGGAGLLLRDGVAITDWSGEGLSKGFETTRHPRTVIARDRAGAIWLITIDGRQPGRASGMTFAEMQAWLARLDVRDALNLDGGGSTTMVVGGEVVNRPSDPTGPRPVSDALVVLAR